MKGFALRASLFCCLLAFLTPFLAHAAGDFPNESRTYLRSDIGYAVQEDMHLKAFGSKYRLSAEDGARCDVVFGYRLNSWFSVEAEAGVAWTRLLDYGQHDYYQVPVLANLAWTYPGEKFRPFVSLGAGGVGLIAAPRNSGPTDKDLVACGQFATGIQYRFSHHLEAGLGYKLLIVAPASLGYVEMSPNRTHSFFASVRYNF